MYGLKVSGTLFIRLGLIMNDLPADTTTFIEANTHFQATSLCPEVEVRLLRPDAPMWNSSRHIFSDDGPRPYWAFAWGSGQSLARYVLDHPEIVQGKRVLDFGSGCGIAAIASAKMGASQVIATEIDPVAVRAIELNAQHNSVNVQAQVTAPDVDRPLIDVEREAWDVLLAGDVFFIWPKNTALASLGHGKQEVLIGMPRKRGIPREHLEELQVYTVRTVPDIEHQLNTESCVLRVQGED